MTHLLGEEKLPSIINDPFQEGKIQEVCIFIQKKMFTNKMYSWGHIKFKNGNTEGKQNFEADTFDEVVLQMKAMIESL